MKILSSHFAAICDKYDSPAPNGSFARRCEAARSSEKNSLTAKIFKYALTAALFLLATAFLIGAAAGYWIIVSRSDVPTSGICLYDSTNLLRYYLADESSDQFGKALDGDLGSASATYDGEFHFPIVSKTPIKKFDGYDKALLPLQFADFNYGGDLAQAYFDDFGYEYVLLTGFSAGAKISPENIKTSAEILKNQSSYTWIAGVPSDAGVYAVRITSLEEVTVVGSSATRSKYGSYIVIYTIAPATATITEAAPLGGSFIVENASSAQSAATMADDSIAGGDGTFIYGVDESGKPLNQGVKVTSLTLGGSSHSVSGYSDSSVGSVKNGLNIVLSDNVKSAANHSEADNENFWYTVTASLSGAEAGNYALSNATSLRFRIAPVELNADDIKWYYDGEATNGKTVVYDGSEHGLTASIDETTVSNRYYAKYGNDESVKSAVKSLIDAINGGSAPLTLGVYARSNDNYTAAIPSTAKVAKNAGIYLFSADVYLGGKRSTDVYLATEATNTLTINAAKLRVNYDPDPVYNGKAQQPNFTLAGLIGNDGMGVNAKVTQGATVVEPINVGSYTLTLSVSGETYLNYVFGEPTLTTETSTSHIYKIIPKPVSLTTSNVSDITYNGVVHAPTATYIDVSGATVDAVTAITKDGTVINANDVKNAGEYTLTASLKDKKNYVWDDNNTTADKTYNWTISKLKITVEVTNANQSATYNGAEPTINTDTTVTLTGSVASVPPCVSNELLFSVTKETGVNAGTYTLTPSAKAKSGYSVDNYDITPTNGTFTINKAALTVTANSENITYGDDKPTFSVSYSGFVNNENESVLGGSLVLECGYVRYGNVGTYSITPIGLTSGNYAITFESGRLKVSKKQITAKISLLSDSIYVTDHVLTVANPSVEFSGLVNGDTPTVTYTAVNNETTVATPLTDSTTLEKGVYTVNAVFSGDKAGNYDITVTAATLTVKENDGTVTKVAVPVANTGLVYNASNQDGITHKQANYGDYYTVSGIASAKNAGDYSVTVTLKDKTNYVWADNNTTDDKTVEWTISKANITITPTVTSKKFTYGTEIPESTISYNIEGTNYNNELTISLVLKDSGSGKICELPSVLDASTYNVSVDVSGDNNYIVERNEDNFEVTPLEVKFSGIININYTDTDKTLNATLLKKGLVKSYDSSSIENLSMPSFSSAVARTYDSSNDDNKAYTETKNAQGNITSISGEHGYYKVTLNNAFTVGSTYKVTAELLNSGNYAFAVGGNTIIVKYKTAKIGNAYYTIEDALSESASGNITLAGNSSGSASYIITSFTKLTYGELTAGYTQEDIDNYFKNYKDCSSTNESINHYTLSGKTLIVPYADGVTASSTESTSAGTDKVYSALIIPNDITLNISSTMNITAEVGHIGTSNVCQVSARGVVMNNGTINVKNGANILAYGYLKGSGTVNLESGATATDLFRIFDFKGGKASYATYEKYFPINSYSLHNISCKTIVNSGSTYKAFYSITASNKWFNGTVNIIAPTSESNTLFKLSSGYIEKSAKPAASWTSSDEEYTALDAIVGSNQICGQIDVIDIHGVAVDGKVKISIKVNLVLFDVSVDMETSKAVPLPIAYMDITICKDAKMTLSNCSYKFMPGAKLTVEEGATLETASGVQLVMYSTSQCNSAENFNNNPKPFYPGLCVDQTDALLIVNGTATIYGRVSGKILSKSKDALLIITTNNTEITVLKSYSDSNLGSIETETTTANAIGNTVDGENQNLENTTYKSQEVGSNIVWVKANNIKTITFDSCGGTLISSKTIILTNDSFTIPATNEDGSAYLETPSLDYYTFVGWFTTKDGGNQISVGSIVSSDITLYAHWTPNTYQIVHEWTGNVPTEFTNPLPASYTTGDEAITLQRLESVTVGESTYTFVGWYYDSGCTKKADKIDTSVLGSFVRNESVTPMTLTVYGNWTIAATYNVTIKYVVRLDGNEATVNDANNNPISIADSKQQFVDGIDNNYTVEITVNGNNLDTSYGIENHNYKYYFAGYSAGSGTNGCTVTQGEEAGKFIIRASNAGEVTINVEFKTKVTAVVKFLDEGNSNNEIRSTQKYFMPGSKYSDMHVAVGTISKGYDTIEKSDSSNGYKYLEEYAIGVTTNGSTIDISNDTNNETLLQSGDTITVTLYYRKIIEVTLTMSATASCNHGWPTASNRIDNPNFTITTITLGLAKWSKDNETWQNSNAPEFTATGSSQFYVLQGSTITVTTDSKTCTYLKSSVYSGCGKKATLTSASSTTNCDCTHSNGTFTITPNGNGDVTVTWSGSVKAS